MKGQSSISQRYVILVRHGSRDFNSDHDESKQAMLGWEPSLEAVTPRYEENGLPRTLAIAHRLVSELGATEIPRIWHSGHTVALQTAEAYRYAFYSRRASVGAVEPLASLDHDAGLDTSVSDSLTARAAPDLFEGRSAVILVGHQPMLTFLARALTRGNLPASTLPLDGSEAACFELRDGKGAKLLWMLTEKPPALMNELREKIKSKVGIPFTHVAPSAGAGSLVAMI